MASARGVIIWGGQRRAKPTHEDADKGRGGVTLDDTRAGDFPEKAEENVKWPERAVLGCRMAGGGV